MGYPLDDAYAETGSTSDGVYNNVYVRSKCCRSYNRSSKCTTFLILLAAIFCVLATIVIAVIVCNMIMENRVKEMLIQLTTIETTTTEYTWTGTIGEARPIGKEHWIL